MKYNYQTSGVCAREINFEINDDIITNINFVGGCNGNLKMLAKLLEGKTADEIYMLCYENICGNRNTSCAGELAKGVKEASLNKQPN